MEALWRIEVLTAHARIIINFPQAILSKTLVLYNILSLVTKARKAKGEHAFQRPERFSCSHRHGLPLKVKTFVDLKLRRV